VSWSKPLFVDPRSEAQKQAAEWRRARPNDAALIGKIAAQSQAIWLVDDPTLDEFVTVRPAIEAVGALPVVVAYNIPNRDLGQHSAGGALSPQGYKAWISRLVDALHGLECVVVLEPDAVADLDGLSRSQADARLELVDHAVKTLAAHANIQLYLDAAHPRWHSPQEMARRLSRASVSRARGFAINVSNFIATTECISYGYHISRMIDAKPFIIDTSRNGRGPKLRGDGSVDWCNPPGRALGSAPTRQTGHELVDALLWIKAPGESDGECNGGPKAGEWWPDYALDLASRASW
jgi:endoglucanase